MIVLVLFATNNDIWYLSLEDADLNHFEWKVVSDAKCKDGPGRLRAVVNV